MSLLSYIQTKLLYTELELSICETNLQSVYYTVSVEYNKFENGAVLVEVGPSETNDMPNNFGKK